MKSFSQFLSESLKDYYKARSFSLVNEAEDQGKTELANLINRSKEYKASAKSRGNLGNSALSDRSDIYVAFKDNAKPDGSAPFCIEVKKDISSPLNPNITFRVNGRSRIEVTSQTCFGHTKGKKILNAIEAVPWKEQEIKVKIDTADLFANYFERGVAFIAIKDNGGYILVPTNNNNYTISLIAKRLSSIDGIKIESFDDFLKKHPKCVYYLKRKEEDGRLRGIVKFSNEANEAKTVLEQSTTKFSLADLFPEDKFKDGYDGKVAWETFDEIDGKWSKDLEKWLDSSEEIEGFQRDPETWPVYDFSPGDVYDEDSLYRLLGEFLNEKNEAYEDKDGMTTVKKIGEEFLKYLQEDFDSHAMDYFKKYG